MVEIFEGSMEEKLRGVWRKDLGKYGKLNILLSDCPGRGKGTKIKGRVL